MSNEPHKPERDFERDLGELQAKWGRMERTEPPDLLDQAVLNAARRDLQPARKRRPLRWLGGFATATVVVLAISVILEQQPPVTAPAEDLPNGLKIQKQEAVTEEADALQQFDQAPMPAAEPRAMTREAKRDTLSVAGAVRAEPEATAQKAKRSENSSYAEMAEVLAEEDALLSPGAWIALLEELKRSDEPADFEAELRAFREAYPDYPLPDSLTDGTP